MAITDDTVTDYDYEAEAEPCGEGMCRCHCGGSHVCGCDCWRCDECMQTSENCHCGDDC
ncbi:hypothetical protein RKD49_002098 [Streptomyces glaucescens]|jgi:hypothetical protein